VKKDTAGSSATVRQRYRRAVTSDGDDIEPPLDIDADPEAQDAGVPSADGAGDGSASDDGRDRGSDSPDDDPASLHDPGSPVEDTGSPVDDSGSDDGLHTALPPKFESWRRRSATGAILTGFALGLQQAFSKEHEQPSIVMETSGDPPTDLPVEADMELARPRQSVVTIRPWLVRSSPAAAPDDTLSSSPEPESEES